MNEWGADAVKVVTLEKHEREALLKKVEETAARRDVAHHMEHKRFSGADFAAGAMATMEALGIACPTWPLQIMAGRVWYEKTKE